MATNTFGPYELSEEQLATVRAEKEKVCADLKINFVLDCSNAMNKTTSYGFIRFLVAKTCINELAKALFNDGEAQEEDPAQGVVEYSNGHYYDETMIWANDSTPHAGSLTGVHRHPIRSGKDFSECVDELSTGRDHPFETVVSSALNRVVDKIGRKNHEHPRLVIIFTDGSYDVDVISKFIQQAAGEIHLKTNDDPRKILGVQIVLLNDDKAIIEKHKALDDMPEYTYDGKTYKWDIVDVTTIEDIGNYGGMRSELCRAKVLAGAHSATLDTFFDTLEPALVPEETKEPSTEAKDLTTE